MPASRSNNDAIEKRVIKVLKRINSEFFSASEQLKISRPEYIFDVILKELISLTDSSYGFVCQIKHEDFGQPYLHALAMTDISWDESSRKMYHDILKGDLNFRNHKSLFGAVMTSGIPVVSNSPLTDYRSGGIPPGHPDLENFMGVPVYGQDDMVGVVGLANCKRGYSKDLYRHLIVILQLVAYFIQDLRQHEQQIAAMQALDYSESNYQELIANMPNAVYRTGFSDTLQLLDISHQIKNITGYGIGDFLCGERLTYSDLILEEDRQLVFDSLQTAMICKTGYDLEYRIRHKDGHVCWVFDKGQAVYNSVSDVRYLSGVLVDITSQKQMEQEKNLVNERMLQAQQMRTLGQMAGGIAHDINNMLASIMGYTELCLEMIAENEFDRIDTYLQQVFVAGERARDVVSSMEAFSNGTDSDAVPLDVTDLFEQMEKVLYVSLPKTITLNMAMDDNMPAMFVDPLGLQQVFVSLCINASDAMQGKGEIAVRARSVDKSHCICTSCHEGFAGRYIEISVSDSGGGVKDSQFSRLFDPFYTTKQMGNGAGMGLAVVHGVLHKYESHICVSNEPGKGMVFAMYIPVAGALSTHQQISA